jgi:murein DD-endopeptidase MepM/ murein hydrolase activator NlpD
MDRLNQLLPRLPAASPLPWPLNARTGLRLDLSEHNPALRGFDPADTAAFSAWIRAQLAAQGADYAVGGYGENRGLYRLSPHFNGDQGEPRTLHLGIDLWLAAGTAVHCVLAGTVHSTRDNAVFGDYGPTVILEHEVEGQRFHTLYGHLARATLQRTRPGQRLEAGALLGWLGEPEENLGWPPHLHFQLIAELGGRVGDYPGVCKPSEAALWLRLSPDPNLLLRLDLLREPA